MARLVCQVRWHAIDELGAANISLRHFLCCLVAIACLSTPAFAQSGGGVPTTMCYPGKDQKYSGGPRGSSHVLLPAMQYLSTWIYSQGVGAAKLDREPSEVLVPCSAVTQPLEDGLYLMGPLDFAPIAVGDICGPHPTILHRMYEDALPENTLAYLVSTKLLRGARLEQVQYRAGRDSGDYSTSVFGNDRFANLIFKIVHFIELECGRPPADFRMLIAMGIDRTEALYAPTWMTVEVTADAGGWTFHADKLAEAAEIQSRGAEIAATYWTKRTDDLHFPRVDPITPGELLARLALTFEAARQAGSFSICNGSDAIMRVTTISAVPMPNLSPRMDITGYRRIEVGACWRITNAHPRMIYGVAVEKRGSDGWYQVAYASSGNQLDHRFTAICAPDEADAWRKENGLASANSCRSGDRRLDISFHARPGDTHFKLTLN